jgi:hypothetical protein
MLRNAIVSSLPRLRLSVCLLIVQVLSKRVMTSTQTMRHARLETVQHYTMAILPWVHSVTKRFLRRCAPRLRKSILIFWKETLVKSEPKESIWELIANEFHLWGRGGGQVPMYCSQRNFYFSRAGDCKEISLYMIWGFHSGDYNECFLLGCYAV